VPSTKTVFPTIEVAFGPDADPGTSCSMSLEPDTLSITLPSVALTVPTTVAIESFIVNPFLVMASFSCLSVAVFPGFIFTAANPFSRLTSTESTPDTDFNDTRTAWAQTSQSMPKILILMDLISAEAENASIKKEASTADSFFI
jgi:hypothetical protein